MDDYDYLLEERMWLYKKEIEKKNKIPFYFLLTMLILNVFFLYYTIYIEDVISSIMWVISIGIILLIMILMSR